ncbi:S9 family peptidase [Alteromonadaceae bacterium M269]|nr:S9 family peptidase [Alteromonadaceae bacterium M269]
MMTSLMTRITSLMALSLCLFLVPKLSFAIEKTSIQQLTKISQERAPSPLIPRSVFIDTPKIQQVTLSPDGKYITYLIDHKKFETLWVLNLDTQERWSLYNAKSIDALYWSTDSQRIFIESENNISSVNSKPGSSPALLVDLSAGDTYFYGVDPTTPQAIFISVENKRNKTHTLYKLKPDLTKTMIYQDKVPLADFIANDGGGLDFIKKVNGDVFEVYHLGKHPNSPQHLFTCRLESQCSLLSYDQAQKALYLSCTLENDLTGLYSYSLETGEYTQIHQDPENRFDLDRVLLNPTTQRPELVRYINDNVSYYGLNKESESLLDSIEKQLPGNLHFVTSNEDFTRLLIIDLSLKKRLPDYYLYDTQTTKVTKLFADFDEKIKDDTRAVPSSVIAQTSAIYYSVSDGMQQQGYLTLPNGIDVSKAPLVLVPHGGPWSRAEGGYHSFVQFLANRGYVVFQPNFRSSTGLGKYYTLSANKDFGDGRVQQDIIDGMQHVLSLGIGDKSKLGIFGHSFGGFSTLGALAFTPELFKVGIAGAPPIDLALAIRLLNERGPNRHGMEPKVRFKLLAVDLDDPKDVQRLSGQSPNAHWQKVQKPLYLLAGAKDRRVSIQNVKDYASRLSAAGKSISLLVDENEGHSFRDKLAREAYFYTLEEALAKHLGGKFQSEISTKLKRYLKQNTVINTHNNH